MDIFELYKKLQRNQEWTKPEQLKQTRKLVYGMTQVEFAELLGVLYETYRSWESGRYTPSSPAQALLHIATHHQDVFLKNRKELLQKVGELRI
jgi:DNA-binding transcriptional regulator YiaG